MVAKKVKNLAENSEKAAKKPRGAGKPFPKGQSGNPGGRPPRTQAELDLVAACKERSPAALAVIESIMMEGQSEKARLAAAQAIIDRGYGKPTQVIDATISTHEACLDDLK
ncbi:MAG: hypothetical protein JO269_09590 [Burkholderiaceae bacterium]|nr:hypothetical protein [Burkholderiaceae bacterium]